jgi:protein-L-isoaspartate(D-aspartate) O-methyltransferase
MSSDARLKMVAEQLLARGIHDARVLEAMARVPRDWFVAAETRDLAYDDNALAIDCEQTISQPYMVALMTQLLAVEPTHRVLEIGTGSGYQAAILCELAGHVHSLERHPQLSEQARERLTRSSYTNFTLHVGDGTHGIAEQAPFDRVVITAAAVAYPPALFEQLVEGGILIAPLGPPKSQRLYEIHKVGGMPKKKTHTRCRFVPLIEGG